MKKRVGQEMENLEVIGQQVEKLAGSTLMQNPLKPTHGFPEKTRK
jgi:hypothetical protein